MKLSSSYEIVGHRAWETSPRADEETAPPGLKERLKDVLPLKIRRTDDASVAQRLRDQFTGRANRAADRSMTHGLDAAPVKKDQSDVGGKGNRNRDAAAKALRVVRLALYDRRFGSEKSNNKRNLQGPAGQQVPSSSGGTLSQTLRSPIEAALKSADVWQSRSLNCGALATAAQDYLMHQDPHLQTSCVVAGGIHALVAVGTVDESFARLPLAQWPRHVHVCDPWANLTCPAPDYPQRLNDKLTQWASEGKELFLNGQWTSPLDERWTSCARGAPRVSARQHYRDGQFLETPLGQGPRGYQR